MTKFSTFLLLFLSATVSTWAGVPVSPPGGPTPPPPAPSAFGCAYGQARADLDINNVRTLLYNGGDMWWDLSGAARYEVPKVDDVGSIKRHSMFAASIWVTGKELGTNNILVMAQTYRVSNGVAINQSFWPGPIDNLTTFTTAARCQVWDKMFKINRLDVLDFESRFAAGQITSPSDIPVSVLTWPAKGNPYLQTITGYEGIDTNYDLARFIDSDGNGIYDPMRGDSPRLPGREAESSGADQCIFWVMNDVGNAKRFSNSQTNNKPIGMEIQTEAFAYATSDYVNDMTFYRQKLINKGTTILADCYFGQWADPDLGYPNDDYVGFNVPRGLAICYNGDDFDEGVRGYGFNPPSIAIDFFKGPVADPNDRIDNDRDGIIDEPGELIIASNFVYYNNSSDAQVGDPGPAQQYYNYMRSIWKNNSPITYDRGNGTKPIGTSVAGIDRIPQAKFCYPGCSDAVGWGNGGSPTDPKPLPCWSEENAADGKANPAGDRRMLTNAGPFTLRPGAVNELTIGVVWARTTSGGPTGSFAKLLAADDAAQKLFDNDFKILDGPDAPDVEITELDGQLLFTIIPHPKAGQSTNTETYLERDFNARLSDPFYRFEGYLVYQLADGTVGFGDLDNPDKAKLIATASSDLKNGVGKIINSEFDEAIGDFVPKVKVNGSDAGLTRTFSLNQDYFGGGKLINFKRYFYTVLAYGYSGDSLQKVKYLQGRQNRQRFSALPHKVNPEQSGTTLQSIYNQSLVVTRLQGIGNSGVTFDSLDPVDEAEILLKNSKAGIRYANGKSPVQVRVYNPKRVVSADLRLRLYSRVTYNGDINKFNIGDTIVSNWKPFTPTATLIRDPVLVQKQGIAVVINKSIRVSGSNNLVDLEVLMLNDGVGGRFTSVFNQQAPSSTGVRFVDYIYRHELFSKKGNPAVADSCLEFKDFDFWRLLDKDGVQVDSSSRPVSLLKDQLSTKYGLLISIDNKINPGEFVFSNAANGYQVSSIRYTSPSKNWIVPVEAPADYTDTSQLNWWRNDKQTVFAEDKLTAPGAIEIAGALRKILDGSFANYGYLSTYEAGKLSNKTAGTGGFAGSRVASGDIDRAIRASLSRIQNVDIVLTSDKSKWTRCVAIQGDTIQVNGTNELPLYNFNKSLLPSVNKDYQPTGEASAYGNGVASTGMTYFPGYAIDLDRGTRLNMAFLESVAYSPTEGNNLKWEPNGPTGNKNYIYVMSTQYDTGRTSEVKLDSIAKRVPRSIRPRAYSNFWARCTWVGRLRNNPRGGEFLSSNVRISLRIDKAYRSYPDSGGTSGVPTYGFTTTGLEPIVKQESVGKNALGLIRAVPNPYYSYSSYEQSQVDNRIRITNLPTKCKLSIYNLSGSLIRQFSIDNSTESGINKTTFQDWDLKTQTGLPIASGAYLIHVDAYNLGQTTVKWFGILRPTDLDAIAQ